MSSREPDETKSREPVDTDARKLRNEAATRLRQTIASIHQEAAERDLTEAELKRLLADEDS